MKISRLNIVNDLLTNFFALVVLIISSPAVFAVTIQPLNSTLQLDVWSDADGTVGPVPEVPDTDRQTQTNSLGMLNVSVDALSSFGGTDSRSHGTSSVTWNNSASGNYSYSVAFDLLNTVSGTSAGIKGWNWFSDTGFFYEFMTDGDSTFSFDYNLGGSFIGSFCASLCAFWAEIDGVSQAITGTGTGTMSFDLLGAGIHTVRITPGTHTLSDTIAGRNTFRDISGTFAWELQAIPIPPALWLFSSGLVGLVGMARRKKS